MKDATKNLYISGISQLTIVNFNGKMEQKTQVITKDTIISEIVGEHPQTVETLLNYSIHCVGCHVSEYETLDQGFKSHGMGEKQVEEAVKKLNEVIEKQPNPKEELKEIKTEDFKINITDKAAEKIKRIIEKEKKQALRISVLPGGCSGFRYEMELADEKNSNDIVIDQKDIKVFIDGQSLNWLNGANVDYVDSLQGAGFKIDNPNATKSCGCGDSFG